MIVIDTIFVFPNESFSYTLKNEINLEKTISYLPAVYLKNRFPSSGYFRIHKFASLDFLPIS